jgi:hypothetical protein
MPNKRPLETCLLHRNINSYYTCTPLLLPPLTTLPRLPVPRKHTRLIPLTRKINRRIPRKEITRLIMQLVNLDRHNRPVLGPRIMRQPKDIPHDEIRIRDIVAPRRHVCHAAALLLRLQSVRPRGVQLVVAVARHPDVVLREEGALRLDGPGRREEFLRRERAEFVGYRVAAGGV